MQEKVKSDSVASSSSALSAFKLLDSAAQFDWTLKLAGAVLFADAAMVAIGGKDFLHWDWAYSVSTAGIGFAIVALLAYSICVSFVAPFLNAICQHIIWRLPSRPAWLGSPSKYDRADGYVTEWELLDLADKEQSKYLQDRIAAERGLRRETAASVDEFGRVSFSTLVIFVLNFFVVDGNRTHTAAGEFFAGLSPEHQHILELVICGILTLPALVAWNHDDGIQWIYYRPLYDEIMAKRTATDKS